MARGANQKEKLMRLLELFISETDESHGISMAEIISMLEKQGIKAERKSIYDDIAALASLGYDVITLPTKPPKYTLQSRPFETAELKILVDAVESSKFVTAERSRAIIEKLRGFAGKYHSGELSRSVYVEDRIKTENDLSVVSIDSIHKAINANESISFKYFDYTWDKRRVFRHGGKRYTVSPISLMWSDENYYLVAYDEEADTTKNFRVDKMAEVLLTGVPRDEKISSERFNPAKYSNKIFGMYGGREELVTLDCREHLAGVVIDRFGTDYTFFKTPFGFKASVRAMISPNFFAWVVSFGGDVKIISPEWVRDELLETITKIRECYDEKI